MPDYQYTLNDRLYNLLGHVNKYVGNYLILGKTKEDLGVDFVDYRIEDDKLFFTYQKVKKTDLIPKGFKGWDAKSRVEVAAGRFLNQLFPDYFTDNEVRDFIETFKYNCKPREQTLEIVQGKDIGKWFHYKNHHRTATDNTTLAQSCMRYDSCQGSFSIYEDNPEVCSLALALIEGKVVARGLLWKAFWEETDEPVTLLDRRYYCLPSDSNFLLENVEYDVYKKSREHAFYTKGDPLLPLVKPSFYVPINKLKKLGYYPYIDTFRFYAKIYNRLVSYTPICDSIEFNKTDGSATGRIGEWNEIIPKGFVYLPYKQAVYDINDTTILYGTRRHKDDIKSCDVEGCPVVEVIINLRKLGLHYACIGHDLIIPIKGVEWKKCTRCQDYSTSKKAHCYKCLATKGPCLRCTKITFQVPFSSMCKLCHTEVYSACDNCNKLEERTVMKRVQHLGTCCMRCQANYGKECTLCNLLTLKSTMVYEKYCKNCVVHKCTKCKNCYTYVPSDVFNQDEKMCSNCVLLIRSSEELPF